MPAGSLNEILTLLSMRREIRRNSTRVNKERQVIKVHLNHVETWKAFETVKKQMIATKSGSYVDPSFDVTVRGLEPSTEYWIALEIAQIGNQSYYYDKQKERWVESEDGLLAPINSTILHPKSPQSGVTWMSQNVTFDKVMLTTELETFNKIAVNINHKYEARLHILTSTTEFIYIGLFPLARTEFIAVSNIRKIGVTDYETSAIPLPLREVKLPKDTVLEPLLPVAGISNDIADEFIQSTKLPRDTVLEPIPSGLTSFEKISKDDLMSPSSCLSISSAASPYQSPLIQLPVKYPEHSSKVVPPSAQLSQLVPFYPYNYYGYYPSMPNIPGVGVNQPYPQYPYQYTGAQYNTFPPGYSWPYNYPLQYPKKY